MKLTITREEKRRRGWTTCWACGLVLLVVWPWYRLLTSPANLHGGVGAPCDCGAGMANVVAKKKLVAFVGVQTGFNNPGVQDQYNYVKRRAVLRKTWFPKDRAALASMEDDMGVTVRFVIGKSRSASQESMIADENAHFGGFLRLHIQEAYDKLPAKTLAFFKAVIAAYDAKYIIKVDDDAYLRIWALPQAVKQWEGLSADYLGCMKRGPIFVDPKQRWYEPQHSVLGDSQYFTHTWGTIYVLSERAAALVASFDPGAMRYFNNEDVTVGSWMLAFNVSHFDDRRLCEVECTASTIAVFDMPQCAGLCNPVRQMLELHADPACSPGVVPTSDAHLPLLPSIIWFKDS